jgi:hypothetical protein
VLVASVTPGGKVTWLVHAGGSWPDRALSLAPDAAGGLVVAGTITSFATFGQTKLSVSGLVNTFLARLRPGIPATWDWAQAMASDSWSRPAGVEVAGKDQVYLAGNFGDQVTIGGTTLKTSGTSAGFLARFSGGGKLSWARAVLGPTMPEITALATDASKNAYLTGKFQQWLSFGSRTIKATQNAKMDHLYVLSASAAGGGRWILGADSYGSSRPVALGIAPAAQPLLLTNCVSGDRLGGVAICSQQGPVLVRFDAAGKVLKARAVQPLLNALGLERDAAGAAYLFGGYRGHPPTLEGVKLPYAGQEDFFVWKLDPP